MQICKVITLTLQVQIVAVDVAREDQRRLSPHRVHHGGRHRRLPRRGRLLRGRQRPSSSVASSVASGEHEAVVHGDLSVLVPLPLVVVLVDVVVVDDGGVGPVKQPGEGDVGGGLAAQQLIGDHLGGGRRMMNDGNLDLEDLRGGGRSCDPGVRHDGLGVHPPAGVPDEQPRDEVLGLGGDAAPAVLLGEHHVAGADGVEEATLATGMIMLT